MDNLTNNESAIGHPLIAQGLCTKDRLTGAFIIELGKQDQVNAWLEENTKGKIAFAIAGDADDLKKANTHSRDLGDQLLHYCTQLSDRAEAADLHGEWIVFRSNQNGDEIEAVFIASNDFTKDQIESLQKQVETVACKKKSITFETNEGTQNEFSFGMTAAVVNIKNDDVQVALAEAEKEVKLLKVEKLISSLTALEQVDKQRTTIDFIQDLIEGLSYKRVPSEILEQLLINVSSRFHDEVLGIEKGTHDIDWQNTKGKLLTGLERNETALQSTLISEITKRFGPEWKLNVDNDISNSFEHKTGLPFFSNENRLYEAQKTYNSINNGNDVYVIIVDIDQLKRINNLFGYEASKVVIQRHAKLMSELMSSFEDKTIYTRDSAGDEIVVFATLQKGDKSIFTVIDKIKELQEVYDLGGEGKTKDKVFIRTSPGLAKIVKMQTGGNHSVNEIFDPLNQAILTADEISTTLKSIRGLKDLPLIDFVNSKIDLATACKYVSERIGDGRITKASLALVMSAALVRSIKQIDFTGTGINGKDFLSLVLNEDFIQLFISSEEEKKTAIELIGVLKNLI